MTGVFLRILGFVMLIAGFYGGIGGLWLTQSEEHPAPELTITVETDTDTLVGMGETLVKTKGGCLLCHKISEQGNTRGPDLRGVGGRAAKRKPGLSAEAYLMESLVEPGAYVVEEFATAGGASIMPAANLPPADMSATELKALIAFLQSMSGEVTVEITAQDVKAAETQKRRAPSDPVISHPGFAVLTAQGCRACHDVIGTARLVGPPLTNVRERLTPAEIRQSILDPNAVIAEGFQPNLMLQDFADKLNAEQLDQLVSYLSGEVSLRERLSHPAAHLAFLILFFNAGIYAAIRISPAANQLTAPGGQVATRPASKRSWRPLGVLVSASVIGVGLYLGLRDGSPKHAEESTAAVEPLAPTVAPIEPVTAPDGKALFGVTCTACHGPDAKGVPGLGKNMTTSAFIGSKSDAELAEFIKQGRSIDDPLNTTGVPMPPMGANPALTDGELMAIVQFIRSLRN